MPTISNLNPGTPVDTDNIPVQQGANTIRLTRAQIVAGVQAALTAEIATTDAEITALQADRLRIDGTNSMTGDLVLSGAPTLGTHATNMTYVDAQIATRLATAGTSTMTGDLDMGTNQINNLVDPTTAQQGATMNYVDTTTLGVVEDYDVSVTSAYPVTYGGAAIPNGAVYRISAAGSILVLGVTHTFEIGDLIISLQALALNDHSHWARVNTNVVTASTILAGVTRLATPAEAIAKTLDTVAVTPLCLATGSYAASATFEGLVELATDTEALAATLATRGLTPSNLAGQVTDYNQFINISNITYNTGGTWTATETGATPGDVYSRRTAAVIDTYTVFDISVQVRLAASFGFELNSIDYVYKIGTSVLANHELVLYAFSYTDDTGTVPTIATPPITTTNLQTANGVNIRVSSIPVVTPAFLNSAVSKYVVRIRANDAIGTCVYDIYGINLRFHKTII